MLIMFDYDREAKEAVDFLDQINLSKALNMLFDSSVKNLYEIQEGISEYLHSDEHGIFRKPV